MLNNEQEGFSLFQKTRNEGLAASEVARDGRDGINSHSKNGNNSVTLFRFTETDGGLRRSSL